MGAGKVFAGANLYLTDATRALVSRAKRLDAARYAPGLPVLDGGSVALFQTCEDWDSHLHVL